MLHKLVPPWAAVLGLPGQVEPEIGARAVDQIVWTAVQRGLAAWRSTPHNAKWWRHIDGTPIPNDLSVCIAEAVTAARTFMPPTPWAYEQATRALDHWRAEAERLGKIAGETPRKLET